MGAFCVRVVQLHFLVIIRLGTYKIIYVYAHNSCVYIHQCVWAFLVYMYLPVLHSTSH